MSEPSDDRSLAHRIAAGVGGPPSLREEIADELADHLASRAEEEPTDDPQEAAAAALRAFGDTTEVVRQLRSIHRGEQIMFQRIMIAILVVVVVCMATASYFVWSASRQTGKQLTGLQEQIAALTDKTATSEPPRIRMFCYTGPPEQPATGYSATIESMDLTQKTDSKGELSERWTTGRSFSKTFKTDSDDWIDTGPLPLGDYYLDGQLLAPDAGSAHNDNGHGSWSRAVRLQTYGLVEQLRLNVEPRYEHEIHIAIPPGITWDRDAMMAVQLSFRNSAGGKIKGYREESWSSSNYAVNPFEVSTLVGLLPGPAKVKLVLPLSERDRGQFASRYGCIGSIPVKIPATNGPITVELPKDPKRHLVGLIYDGSKDRPLVGAKASLVVRDGRWWEPHGMQAMVTGADGRFGGFRMGNDSIDLLIGGPEGRKAIFSWPLEYSYKGLQRAQSDSAAECYEIDVSKLVNFRITLTGAGRLPGKGVRLSGPPSLRWTLTKEKLLPRQRLNWPVPLDWPEQQSVDLLLFPGKYTFSVYAAAVSDAGMPTPIADRGIKLDLKAGQPEEISIALDELTASTR